MSKFILRIGDNEIQIEGDTRDAALRKIGLNPKHWQDDKGENMEKQETTYIPKKQPRVVNTPERRPGRPPKTEAKSVSYGHKPNITLEDIGQWYTDGKDVWKLEGFIPEPQVTMSRVASVDEIKKGNLSEFQNFRRLIPEPEPRKRLKKHG